jgi:Protein of unknown function (DUF2793)
MSDSINLVLPYLEAAQAQKHVTVNEALSKLDALVHLAVLSRVVAIPPASPVDGDRYLLPASPTGAWSGQAGKVALRLEGTWVFATPREGWRLWVSDEDVLLSFNGTTWNAAGVPTSLQNMQAVGINATADATNKLVVSSSATLFNHAGNGHQIKLNKAAAGDSASLLWQTNFSGRAEIGTVGNDALALKVSANGSSFLTMLLADAASGRLELPQGVTLLAMTAPVTPVDGQIWSDTARGRLLVREAGVTRELVSKSTLGQMQARALIMN